MTQRFLCRAASFWGALAVFCFVSTLHADVRMPEIFASGMVLQRDLPLPVWGFADPGESVTVTLAGQSQTATADAGGRWMVKFAPQKVTNEPIKVVIKGRNEVVLDDVLIGEVWLCSGQSNMEWRMNMLPDTKDDVASANFPSIRLFQVDRIWKATPQTGFKSQTWTACTPETVNGFSAVGFFFGCRLHQELDVPVGLINTSWGGTRIEPWTSPSGFEKVASLKSIADEITAKDPTTPQHKQLVEKTLEEQQAWIAQSQENLKANLPFEMPPDIPAALTPYSNHQQPTVLYNQMVHPAAPLALRGAIWYQGESNLGDGKMYGEKMRALIEGWRTVFQNKDLAFYFVQLAPFNYGGAADRLPLIWETQAEVAKNVENTGMAVINDIGNLKDIHPTQKQKVGARLADLALHRTYAKSDVVCDFPEFKSLEISGSTAVLKLDHAKGLKTRDGKAPDWFEMAGADGVFKPANAVIDGESIKLTNDSIAQPYAVRFAWSMLAEPNLQNGDGLPMSAFRAGEIPERGVLDTLVPDAKKFQLLYSFNPINPAMIGNNQQIVYQSDKSKEIVGKVKRVGYFLYLKKKGESKEQYVFVTMPPLSQELGKLGVPTKASGARFQQKVSDVTVTTNVPGVESGTFADGCNVEFWDCNYAANNAAGIPGASDQAFDFGDQMSANVSPGYGSLQIHHFAKKQTILAFNNFNAGPNAEVGIGNSPEGNPDWTFTKSANQFEGGQFLILVEME